jgi:ABC-2 type transport system ATP-binding protein
MSFLEIQQVTKQYSNHLALDSVSLAIERNSIYGLLGPNGAGKTTLIRIINQITAPDEGLIFLEGKPIKSHDVKRIGYLPEERGLYKKMKVGEQAIYLARLKGLSKAEATQRLKTWFERLDMQSWWDKKVEELSKGMQQKVQFIITVMHEPELLIFDEPFSGFDPVNADIMKREMVRLRDAGATIIFSTHNMESVEELCDDITLINRSKVVLQGNVNQIRQQYRTYIYRIILEGIIETITSSEQFRVLDQTIINNHTSLHIETINSTANEVIASLLPHYTLLSFEEEIPSMNDIFIRIVKEPLPVI